MTLFKYIYFRMYKAYEAKNDSPFLRSLIYISILKMFILAVLFLYLKGTILRLNNIEELNFEKPIHVWSAAGIILLINYLFYSRLNINNLEELFGRCYKLNRRIKLWMLIVLPFLFLFGALLIYVFIFGGTILGRPYTGLLN